jgi:isoleucyl-tRNA synthetase
VELFGGQRVFDANRGIEEALKERGRLWHRETFSHQYPHCWRCHNPVIFLATSQWFISMDDARLADVPASSGRSGEVRSASLRSVAIDAIDQRVKWVPAWGRDRIYGMVASRPDWCVSRQRAWGVPIPAVDCRACGEAILTTALVERAARVFDAYGADAWYERPIEEFLPPDLTCPRCGGAVFEREMNILDVWFDSGSSHEAVLSVRPELSWPADIYLEGSDQHRGWFQSSLLVGLGTRGRPPFKEVVTHGFIVAEDGRKMSKSLGNSIEPQDIIRQSGADILRLWVAMSDYSQEIRLSKEILARVVEAYRKLRNTLRYLSANLYDFDPAAHWTPYANLEEIDRFILARYGEVGRRTLDAYEAHEYATICQLLNAFTTVDLSAFYNDISKDRLYTFGARSHERRSAQMAMFLIADGLTRLMAPILSFTADELWRFLPGNREESVHIAVFPERADLEKLADQELLQRWNALMALRERVLAEIEPLRKDKKIGSSLQAKVILTSNVPDLEFLRRHERFLPMLFIVSEVELQPGGSAAGPPQIEIARAGGVKCERCWRYVRTVATDPVWAGLCERCQDALAEPIHG